MHGRAQQLHHLGPRRRGAPEFVDAAVVGHPVEPGPQRKLAAVSAQAGVGPHEDVLQRVLGVLAMRQHLARVGEQPLPVAVVNHPEGVVVAGPEHCDELLVGAEAKKRRGRVGRVGPSNRASPGYGYRCWECGRFHCEPVLTLTREPEEGFRSLSNPVLGTGPAGQDKDTVTSVRTKTPSRA